uniref:Kazal-like domain-containing protein n=1 Tax=Pseudonaja textilis TaxID=8673 RepID=A0A670XMV6_PSETE
TRPNGELTCTRENDPVRDDSGQTHSNKCIMCAEQLNIHLVKFQAGRRTLETWKLIGKKV